MYLEKVHGLKMKAKMIKEKIKNILRQTVEFILNPRLLLCLGGAWMVTNGWSYVMFAVGTWFEIGWMLAVSGAYLTFLWLPVSPEKLVTVALAIVFLRFFFPNDLKTLGKLRSMHARLKALFIEQKNKRKNKKRSKKASKTDNDPQE